MKIILLTVEKTKIIWIWEYLSLESIYTRSTRKKLYNISFIWVFEQLMYPRNSPEVIHINFQVKYTQTITYLSCVPPSMRWDGKNDNNIIILCRIVDDFLNMVWCYDMSIADTVICVMIWLLPLYTGDTSGKLSGKPYEIESRQYKCVSMAINDFFH